MIAKAVNAVLRFFGNILSLSVGGPTVVAFIVSTIVALFVVGWEFVVTFWHMPWLSLSLIGWITAIFAVYLAVLGVLIFFEMIGQDSTVSLYGLARLVLAPITFFGGAFALQYFQLIERPLTIGTYLGDLFAVFFFLPIVSIGVLRGIEHLAVDSDNLACTAAMLRAAAMGPDGLLAEAKKLPERTVEFLQLPTKHPQLYQAMFGPALERAWYDLRWQGTASLVSYVTMGSYLAACSLRGAFPDGFSEAATWAYAKLLELLP